MNKSLCFSMLLPVILVAADQPKVNLPAPYATPASNNAPKLVAQPDGKKLNLPAGFQSEEFASGFKKPRYMIQASGGAVLVTRDAGV